MSTLYEQLGGADAIDAVVDEFYRIMLADDRVAKFFEDTDMERQAAKQKGFLTFAFGGPNNYTGMDMREGHAHLLKDGLNDSHVDAVIENLGAALKKFDVSDELIAQAAAVADSVRDDVLSR